MLRSICQSLNLFAKACLVLAVALWLAGAAAAQETDDDTGSRLIISSSDASSAPTIILRAYGMDAVGSPIDLTPDKIVIQHDGREVADVEVVGDYQAGTLTVFVVDVPPGVASQLPAIEQAIEQYASPPEMAERVDYLAIFQVGDLAATQLLAPTNFFNAIRNFLATPLETQSGPTALVDSVGALLGQMESLKPKSDMVASIVLITDGTDVVSTQVEAEELGKLASEFGVPVHTIWLENENLQPFSHEAGRDYLARLAADSGAVAARLDQPSELQNIWNRIAAFRTHPVIQYRPQNLTGGEYEVVLSLRDDPAVQDSTTVSISAEAPSVTLDLPPESRELVLENLDSPVELALSTTIVWLDGAERALTSAELLVNGAAVQEIDVRRIDRFRAEIGNFSYGPNRLQVAVVDELGQRATSPEIVLDVLEGETQVPEQIQADGAEAPDILRIVLACFAALFVLALIALLVAIARRIGLLGRLPFLRSRRASPVQLRGVDRQMRREYDQYQADSTRGTPTDSTLQDEGSQAVGAGAPYLEILESVTRMPLSVDLTAVEHRIGRSPALADIVFENDITVSRLHASVVLEGSDYRLYDEGSTSGTWVNDQSVPEYGHQLMDGDEIRLGAARLRYRR